MMPHPTSPAHAPRYVFVYGTLRQGGRNDIARYRPQPELIGRASITGTLYDLGAYPGARLDGAGPIHGEIYRITREVEAELDVLEEVQPDGSGEYVKRELRVTAPDGEWPCLIYEIQLERVRGTPVIASGDWLQRN